METQYSLRLEVGEALLDQTAGNALSLGETFPMWKHLAILLLLGYVAYGLSIFFYTLAQRGIGAAKTSTYYALAPFIGAFLSVVVLGEPIGWMFIVATLVMAAGCWLAGR